MAINTGSFGKALWPGVNAWYGKTYDEFPTEYDKIFEKKTSKKAYEEDVSISSFGLAIQKGEGSPISMDTEQQGFLDRYTHVTYGLGFTITKEIYEDDQYDIVGERKAKGLAMSMRQTKETIAANVLNRAFNSSYTFGDGVSLVNTAHPNVAGGTFSNQIATAADISEAALEQAVIDLGKYTNDRGLKIAVKPVKIVVPVDIDFETNKILETQYEVGTNNNTVNLVRSRFPGGVHVNHYLTDTDAWFIITNVTNGMKYFERRADAFTMDDDFDTDNAKYKATARYSFGCSDKRAIYASPGA
ncbi:MAG: phage major capsid protein [Nitrosotalea sp.]